MPLTRPAVGRGPLTAALRQPVAAQATHAVAAAAVPHRAPAQPEAIARPAPRPPLTQPAAAQPVHAPVEPPPVRSGLFAEPPRPSANRPAPAPVPPITARPSLFGIVTGALRRGPATGQAEMEPAPQAHIDEPEAPVRVSPRAPVSEDAGLDIPAFLRRQN
jgi:hypothetical protein